jgi:hypothetical protein
MDMVPGELLARPINWSTTSVAIAVLPPGHPQVRWTSTEYFLISQLDPSQNKRPVVRTLADTLLQVGAVEREH